MRLVIISIAFILCAATTAYAGAPGPTEPARNGVAAVVTIDGPIGPATSEYVADAFAQANALKAKVVIVKLDTPGGLATSMRQIIKIILASPIPVIGYTAPSGARAASAGTYIMYATAIAAMAPSTNIGAATPVPVRGTEKPTDLTAEQRKILNDSVAYIRGLAAQHGRNVDWAEKAVRQAASLPAQTALEKNVINLIAPSTTALLQQIDGQTVSLNGESVILHTAGLTVHTITPGWRTEFLSVISNPTLVYILFLAGIVGIILEVTHPGLMFPGVIGAICLLLAFFGFHILPVNYAGVALILLGIGLMVAEAYVPSFGSLGVGGIAAFVAGSVFLMNTNAPGFEVKLSVIIAVAAVIAIGLALLIPFAIRAHKRKVVSGAEEMIGATAIAMAAFNNTGQVRVHGEIWRANTPQPVHKNQSLTVISMHGLSLDVEPTETGDK